MDTRLARFLIASASMTAAHQVADHWVQTDHQAAIKGGPGWRARLACARHVATYTATQALALGLTARWLKVPLAPRWAVAGLAVSAATHYFADRREPLRRVADTVGLSGFYRLNSGGLNGAYLMDQSFHYGWIFVAALLTAGRD